MRLKRVRIFGFKTFADKTEFSLDGGIIAVVGPNGCGKSNLVDAILWGLGEGNSRHLRAQNSQDVIFGGSSKRKPVGFAEVSLLFDNEDGSLPIDTAEVTITRRLNRAGDSDYYINRRACRQRDIHELLADSGLGRAGYAIVGQKEIDQALAASADDRRAWVDEAAGVQRYRARKVESIKRLSSAKDHLTRVDDILHELDNQREPLRAEAEIAVRYRSATDALRSVETGLLMQDLAKAVADLVDLEARLSTSAETARLESDRAERLDVEILGLRAKMVEREGELDRLRSTVQDLTKAAERADANVRLAEERLRSLDQLEESLRHQSGAEAITEAVAELELARERHKESEARLNEARLGIGGVSEEADQLRLQLAALDKELTEARQSHLTRVKQLAEREVREERRTAGLRELEGIQRDLPQLQTAIAGAEGSVAESEGLYESTSSTVNSLRAEVSSAEAALTQLASESRERMAEKAALEGRRRGIEATLLANEGLTQGARAVLEGAKIGRLSATYVPVGDAISTRKEQALAVETALGAAANDLIVEREADAKAAIQYLKENRLGRATFQPIPLMRSVEPSSELRRVLNTNGVLGRAADLVTCDPVHRPVVDSLLGRVLIVRDLDVSLGLAKSHGWNRIVTLDGEVVHSSGAVTGGVQSKQHYGLVQRKSDLQELERQIKKLEQSLQKEEGKRAELEDSRSALAEKLLVARAEVEIRAGAVREAKQYLQTLRGELAETEKIRTKLETELQRLSVAVELGQEPEVDRLQQERDSLMAQLAEKSADANQAKRRLADAEAAFKETDTRVRSAAKRLEVVENSEATRGARIAALEPERVKIRGEVSRAVEERERASNRSKMLEADLREEQTAKERLLQEIQQMEEEAKAARANLSALAAANHQAELNRARADAKRASAEERLLEEYGIAADEALEQADTIEVPSDAAPLAARLRREIKGMGMVNLGAIEAFDRLTGRHEELTHQRADILEGIEQVQGSMRALDQLTRDRFVETFTKVEQAYAEIFQKLFGGGEGRVFLDNPSNILESGIEIEVTLPGKKRQRLELLSGGERALCASGFLFALLHTKPSPLVVLDEVDAPLDGRNVERFADVLAEFTDRCQFIVITHNPTTIERAPVWLGVTMQEPGVSTLVPARLPVAV